MTGTPDLIERATSNLMEHCHSELDRFFSTDFIQPCHPGLDPGYMPSTTMDAGSSPA